LQAPVVEIRQGKELDVSGGVVVEAFPSVGLVSAIVGTYIISSLKLDQIAAMDSTWFPAVSMIYGQKPKFPARIYASGQHKIAVCLSEFTMPVYLDRFIAKSILSWANEHRCSLVISLCGMPVSEEENMQRSGVAVLGVGSTERTRQILKDNGIPQLDFGVVPGITGALLNEGRWNAANVIALIVETHSEVSDARVAAAMVEAIDMLLSQIDLEVSPLYVEAEEIESRLRSLREQAKPARSSIRPSPYA
jgi:uncharacterized protein